MTQIKSRFPPKPPAAAENDHRGETAISEPGSV
jgi:hypothetical protein